jgi:NADH-quinone oxidoreductase subunit C
VPDATGLELIAQRVRDALGDDAVVGTSYYRDQASLEVAPERVRDVLAFLKNHDEEPFEVLSSLHGCDYLPDEPRLGVHYELLSMKRVERLRVKTRVTVDNAHVPSVVELWPGANFQEREVWDMFGVEFGDHPDHRRILMPEDYEGHPQRRDFPIGGEPVIFTFNQDQMPRWYE